MGSKFLVLVAAGVVLAAGCTPSEAPKPAAPPPPPPAKPVGDVITAKRGGFIPEGVEYDQANGRFLTGSLAEGTIFEIKRDGSRRAVRDRPRRSSPRSASKSTSHATGCSSRIPIAPRSSPATWARPSSACTA